MAKTIVTKQTESLIAYHTLKSGADIITKRLDRQLKPVANEIYTRLVKGQKINDPSVTATYRFENKDKARTLTEGIEEFSKRFPEYGAKLKDIISETRKTKRRYLCFGENDELPQETYTQVLKNIGIPQHMQKGLVANIKAVSDALSQRREDGLMEILIK